jgi:hypothetical protein
MHIQVDHTKPNTKIQAEQVQWVFGGPQASSCEDANIVLDQGKPWCIEPDLIVFCFWILLYVIVGCALSW